MNGARTTIAIVGNPNCGKTTLFNALTGRDQRVGNWPGVTVERKEGTTTLVGRSVTLVDLPGVYALLATSEDERVARDYILGGEPGLVVNIIDGSNLERNLFLTTQLLDMRVPLVLVVNMIDIAESRGITVDVEELGRRLGCPAVAIAATRKHDVRRALEAIAGAWDGPQPSDVRIEQPAAVEALASTWEARLEGVAGRLGANGRWLALKLLERDGWAIARVVESGALGAAEIERETVALEAALGEPADITLAEARYRFVDMVVTTSVQRPPAGETVGEKVDRIVLNRFLGIPIFLGAMYLLFWFAINVGGAFIDFFDILGGVILVDGIGSLLEAAGSPEWLVTIVAGVGAGIQTVLTFIPIIFAMFVGLSILEDSGYMARAAFVMDRFMRRIGMPGKSFVPLLVGFGCNVPAIMATRTLDSRRDRYLTIFMSPFMSCGARLPVYALFGAAFFGAAAGVMTFSLYLVGIAVAILTGLLLNGTIFRGEPSYFIMELPPYHRPRLGNTMRQAWSRLVAFITNAGRYIVPIVAFLAVLNSIGTDGKFGNEDTESSVLSEIGKMITPIFAPLGMEEENWPATVGIFTGILAKEAVVGTLSSLYGQEAAAIPDETGEEKPGLVEGLGAALASVPANVAGLPASLADPFGFGLIDTSTDVVAENVGASASVFVGLQAGFTEGRPQAYAYLLLVLLYLPCVAVFGAMTREMGLRYTTLALVYVAVVSWAVATLFYQVTVTRDLVWILVATGLLAAIGLTFWFIGGRVRSVGSERLTAVEGAPAGG